MQIHTYITTYSNIFNSFFQLKNNKIGENKQSDLNAIFVENEVTKNRLSTNLRANFYDIKSGRIIVCSML